MTRSLTYSEFPRDPPALKSDSYRYFRLLSWFEKCVGADASIDGSRWLDCGSHSGSFLRSVIACYGPGSTGCDVFPEDHKTQRLYESFQLTENENWNYRQRDVSQGLDGLGTFQVISALEIIEHLIDTDKFLDEVHTHLDLGGYLLLTTPNLNNLINRVRVPLGKYPIGLEYRNVIHSWCHVDGSSAGRSRNRSPRWRRISCRSSRRTFLSSPESRQRLSRSKGLCFSLGFRL